MRAVYKNTAGFLDSTGLFRPRVISEDKLKLTSPKIITRLLAENNLNPLKKFGQNFLIDENIVNKIAEASAPEGGRALEIGMGLGALTAALAARAGKIVTIDIDKGLIKLSRQTLSGFDNVTVIENDILKTDFEEIYENCFEKRPFYVCGNLPYYITAPIIMRVLESRAGIEALTAMVQKEVAERLCARPGDPDYGVITAAVDYFGGARKLFNVSRNCFYPPPKVDSAVVRIDISKKVSPPFSEYSKLVRTAFSQRRKTIANNLKALFGDDVKAVLNAAGVPPDARAQDVSWEEYIRIIEVSERFT